MLLVALVVRVEEVFAQLHEFLDILIVDGHVLVDRGIRCIIIFCSLREITKTLMFDFWYFVAAMLAISHYQTFLVGAASVDTRLRLHQILQ